jgi:ATP-dependent DNA helicase RecG
VESLIENGLVEAQGDGKRRAYTLSAKVYRKQNNTVGYVRQTGIDAILYDELVLKLARQQGEVRRADVSQLLNISPSQAYRLLKRLALEEKLTLVGEGRGAHYEIL